jgi:hypothetical protein
MTLRIISGFTIETVSRTVTEFENDGLIAQQSRRSVALIDSDWVAKMVS